MSTAVPAAFSHIGLCVADIERARRFYVDALGFSEGPEVPIDDSMSTFIGLPNLSGKARFLVHGTMTLELLEFQTPAFIPVDELRPMNLSGLTHLSFRVADVDEAAARIAACGGAIVTESRLSWKVGSIPMGELVFCTDPDGNRIELAKLFEPAAA